VWKNGVIMITHTQYEGGREDRMASRGMVYVNLHSAIVANVSNALRTLVPGKRPSFQALFEGDKVLLCADVIGQRVPNHRAVHSECSAANSGEPVSWPVVRHAIDTNGH